ncbi:MAG: NAD(P)/FAD-dependent oxidoreductase [Bacillota bacterium]
MRRFLIIGNGAAGLAAAEAIRGDAGRAGGDDIMIVSDEPHPAYSRCLIPGVVAGELGFEALSLRPPGFYGSLGFKTLFGRRVTGIDSARHRVILENGTGLEYDALLLATGARPAPGGVPGSASPGVFSLRTYEDATRIAAAAEEASSAVVVGGGLVGLKAAVALRKRGLKVTVVVKSPWILSKQLDRWGAVLLQEALAALGIGFVFGQNPVEFARKRGRLMGVRLEDGACLPAGLVIVGKGVVPEVRLAREAGINVAAGVLVDRHLRTSAPGVYAAGDCCEVPDLVTGERSPSALWTLAVEQGRLAGLNMSGRAAPYEGGLTRLNTVEFGGIPVASAGLVTARGNGFHELSRSARGAYRKIILRDGRLVGAVLVGDISRAGVYAALIRRRAVVEGLEPELLSARMGANHFPGALAALAGGPAVSQALEKMES